MSELKKSTLNQEMNVVLVNNANNIDNYVLVYKLKFLINKSPKETIVCV